jgi:hypothetical protein
MSRAKLKETAAAMATQTATQLPPKQNSSVEQKLQEVRELYADAPEVGRVGLEKMIAEIKAAATDGQQRAASAGRTGLRQGKVSELTSILTLAPGGATRLRALLKVLGGNFQGADKVGTLHDMRFVFLENDTKMLFATTYDGDWDTYIDDFSTKIPDSLDVLFSNMVGYPPKGMHDPAIKDWITRSRLTAGMSLRQISPCRKGEGWKSSARRSTNFWTRLVERSGQTISEGE